MRHVSADIFNTLSFLKPFDIDISKTRVGKERDGGYIMADIPSMGDVISFGVGPEISFEVEMAVRGRRVFMFDHTVDSLPAKDKLFHFTRLGLCGETSQADNLRSLEQHLASLSGLTSSLTLKMDVEGAEWDCFATTPTAVLRRFDQIVLEIHWLRNLDTQPFRTQVSAALQRLTSVFTLFHVHANNCGELYIVGGFAVADVLELSFVRSDLITRSSSTSIFPESLNKSNHPDAHDLPLLFYPFLPLSVPEHRVNDVVRRIILEERVKD